MLAFLSPLLHRQFNVIIAMPDQCTRVNGCTDHNIKSITDANVPDTERDVVFSAKLNSLMREWYKSSDALFCIHPVDGSLLVWNVDWLDDDTRQPRITFSSRLPSAFALTYAVSLQKHLITFNPHDPVFVDQMQSENTVSVSRLPMFSLQPRNPVFLLTSHVDASLNLWHLTPDEKSKFSIVLNISQRSRMGRVVNGASLSVPPHPMPHAIFGGAPWSTPLAPLVKFDLDLDFLAMVVI